VNRRASRAHCTLCDCLSPYREDDCQIVVSEVLVRMI